MAHEAGAIKRWLKKTLGDDAEIKRNLTGVYNNIASQKAQMPFLVWGLASSSDDNTTGARASAGIVMFVRVVYLAGNHDKVAENALERVEALLDNQKFVQEGLMFRIKGEGVIDYPETLATAQLNHTGRFWRFIVSAV